MGSAGPNTRHRHHASHENEGIQIPRIVAGRKQQKITVP
jgi:hypothetical protein